MPVGTLVILTGTETEETVDACDKRRIHGGVE